MSSTKSVLVGLLIGGAAGAAAMLLLAPQSGKRTRARILQEGTQLRDRTNNLLGNALAQIRSDAHENASGGRARRGRRWRLDHDSLVRQLDRVSAGLDARKTAVRDS